MQRVEATLAVSVSDLMTAVGPFLRSDTLTASVASTLCICVSRN